MSRLLPLPVSWHHYPALSTSSQEHPSTQRSTHQGQRSQGQLAMQGSVEGLSWTLTPRARAVPGGSQAPKGCPAPLKPPPPWAERLTPLHRPSCVPTPVPIVTSFLFCCHCLMAESEKWEDERGRDCACWGPGREGCSERYKLKGAEHRQHEQLGCWPARRLLRPGWGGGHCSLGLEGHSPGPRHPGAPEAKETWECPGVRAKTPHYL